jgi:hypothetical protein
MDDPSQLANIVTSPTAGAGAGVLTWNKTNWLLTAYAPTAPVIIAQPQNQTVAPSNSINFTVAVSGSAPLAYQWYFNTNSPLAGATNSAFVLNNVQMTNAGTYSVSVSNSAGSVTSAVAVLAVSSGAHAKPHISGLVLGNGTFSMTVNGDSGVDYIVQASTNLLTWDNLFTNHSPAMPFNWSDNDVTNFIQRFYRIQIGP